MYFGEINFGIRVWFARRVRQSLEAIRDYKENGWETRQQLADPELFEWVAEWYCEHIAEFISDNPGDTFCVDDIHNDERVEYQSKEVGRRCPCVRGMAMEALAEVREAQRFTDLDTWLEALLAGQLEWDGSTEREGYKLVADVDKFLSAKRMRQRNWPRLCRECSTEFRPDRANARNCPDCRAKQRRRRLTLL